MINRSIHDAGEVEGVRVWYGLSEPIGDRPCETVGSRSEGNPGSFRHDI